MPGHASPSSEPCAASSGLESAIAYLLAASMAVQDERRHAAMLAHLSSHTRSTAQAAQGRRQATADAAYMPAPGSPSGWQPVAADAFYPFPPSPQAQPPSRVEAQVQLRWQQQQQQAKQARLQQRSLDDVSARPAQLPAIKERAEAGGMWAHVSAGTARAPARLPAGPPAWVADTPAGLAPAGFRSPGSMMEGVERPQAPSRGLASARPGAADSGQAGQPPSDDDQGGLLCCVLCCGQHLVERHVGACACMPLAALLLVRKLAKSVLVRCVQLCSQALMSHGCLAWYLCHAAVHRPLHLHAEARCGT